MRKMAEEFEESSSEKLGLILWESNLLISGKKTAIVTKFRTFKHSDASVSIREGVFTLDSRTQTQAHAQTQEERKRV